MKTIRSETKKSRRDFLRKSAVAALLLIGTRAHQAGAAGEKKELPEHSPFHHSSDFASLPRDRWPGRLIVGGKTLDDFVVISEEPHTEAGWSLRVFQSVSIPALQVRTQWRVVGAVTEYIPTLVNNAPESSGKVTELRSLAASWPTRGPVDFYGNKGSNHEAVDFGDITKQDIDLVEMMPLDGRSSDGTLPFFALTDQHDSLALGIGWSGRWAATFRHVEGALQVEIGLPQVGFVLHPWESVRLPSILLARAHEKTADQARRIVRSHVVNRVMPKGPDGKSPNFTAASMMFQYIHGGPIMNEKSELALVDRAAALGFETHWVDATWNGYDSEWTNQVGNWNVRESDLPRGLRPISDRAHELGMKFVFWMEPERARPDSDWARAHPDLFLSFPNDGKIDAWRSGLLLNLGDPRAVDLAFNTISALITEFNTDVFRHDFNMRPLDAWYSSDPPDRVGISEIRYMEGFYTLWDRILAAHPGLVIENVASGGRRIDLETLRRSMPLWRSDYLMFETPDTDVINQIHGWGLGHWVADHFAFIKTFDAYAIRSGLSTGFIAYRALPEDKSDPEYADAMRAIAENKRLRPLLAEERIGLIAPSLKKKAWVAYQHHRHSDSSGIIVALRGPGAADEDTVTLKPEHIEANATYQVTRWDDYVAAPPAKVAGTALKELAVTITQTRSSVLIEYKRVAR